MPIPSKGADIKLASPNLLRCEAGRGFQSRPRYGPISDEVVEIVSGEGVRYERLQSYVGLVAVDLDSELEGVKYSSS
jgi:hypothetical protein